MSSCVLLVVVHLFLRYRRRRHLHRYRDDKLVSRITGLGRSPNISIIIRQLTNVHVKQQAAFKKMSRDMALDRLDTLTLYRVPTDFDVSVIGINRYAERAAVESKWKEKGQRSDYLLIARVPQSALVLDVLYRSANVQDSKGSLEFIDNTLSQVLYRLSHVQLETRMDAVFYSEASVKLLDQLGARFPLGLPFERFGGLKEIVESRLRWMRINSTYNQLETKWKPSSWEYKRCRIIVIGQRSPMQRNRPILLVQFESYDEKHEYKAIVTNDDTGVASVMAFHNSRGSQEGLFAVLKSHAKMNCVPCKRWYYNKIYITRTQPTHRGTYSTRFAYWALEKLDTIRQLVLRAGRLKNTVEKLMLSMAVNYEIEREFTQIFWDQLRAAVQLNVTNLMQRSGIYSSVQGLSFCPCVSYNDNTPV